MGKIKNQKIILSLKYAVNRGSRLLTLVFFAVNLFCLSVYPSQIDESSPLSFKNVYNFTKHLISTGEYYRANVEIDRLLSSNPEGKTQDKLRFSKLYVLFNGERYNEIAEYDENVFAGDADRLSFYNIFRFDSLVKLGQLKDKFSFNNTEISDGMLTRALRKRMIYLEVFSNEGIKYLKKDDFSEYRNIVKYREIYRDELVSPALAAALGILPGAGYCYAGHPGTGVLAFMTVGIGSFFTYEFYQNGSPSLSILSGMVTMFFYGGSIIGGYLEAKKYNDNQRDRYSSILFQELDLDKDRERAFIKFGIGL